MIPSHRGFTIHRGGVDIDGTALKMVPSLGLIGGQWRGQFWHPRDSSHTGSLGVWLELVLQGQAAEAFSLCFHSMEALITGQRFRPPWEEFCPEAWGGEIWRCYRLEDGFWLCFLHPPAVSSRVG